MKAKCFLLFVWFAFSSVINVFGQTPNAIIESSKSVAFCESGDYNLVIQFTGSYSFGYVIDFIDKGTGIWIKSEFRRNQTDALGASHPTNTGDKKFSIPLTLSVLTYGAGIKSRNYYIKLKRVFDGTIPFIPATTDWDLNSGTLIINQQVEVVLDQHAVPQAGLDKLNHCGYVVTLDGVRSPLSTTYHWETSTAGTFTDNTIEKAVFTSATVGSKTFEFIQQNGICRDTDKVVVDFLGSAFGVLSGASNICKTGALPVTANFTGVAPFTYKITDGTTVDPTLHTSITNTDVFNQSVNGAKNFAFAEITDNNTCKSTAIQMTGSAVTVDIQPNISAGSDKMACAKSTTLAATADKGSGTWSSANSLVIFSNASNPASSVTVPEYGYYDFKWEVDNAGCKTDSTVTIHFPKPPTLAVISPNTTICEGGTTYLLLTFTGNAPYKVDYSFDSQNVQSTFNLDNGSMELSPVNTTTYSFNRITGQYGCTANLSNNFMITVDKKPTAFAGDDAFITKTYSYNLQGTVPQSGTGSWEVVKGKGFFSDINSPTSKVDSLIVGDNLFRWKIESAICADAKDSVLINVKLFNLQNGFSPNNDGVNDYFIIDGADKAIDSEFIVFNKIGKVMYKTTHYDNSSPWDGRDLQGKLLPDDTYYYVFSAKNLELIKGFVIIKTK